MTLKKCKCGKGVISCNGYNVYYRNGKNLNFYTTYTNHTKKELIKSLKILKSLNNTNYSYREFKSHNDKNFKLIHIN